MILVFKVFLVYLEKYFEYNSLAEEQERDVGMHIFIRIVSKNFCKSG